MAGRARLISSRRRFIATVGGGAAIAGLAAACGGPSGTKSAASSTHTSTAPSNPSVVRVATVYTPYDSGLLPSLVPGFEQQAPGKTVKVTAMNDVFAPAMAGEADLVICHYAHRGVPGRQAGRPNAGHHGVVPGSGQGRGGGQGNGPTTSSFVLADYGLWPAAVFSNQALVLGPPSDPARIAGMTSAIAAFKKLAASGQPFLAAPDERVAYLNELLLAASGVSKGSWYQPSSAVGDALLAEAAAKSAYTIWGNSVAALSTVAGKLVPLVVADPLLQRLMVAIVVDPAKVRGVNATGAHDFQSYLISPSTQAKIVNFREASFSTPTFWPAGVSDVVT